MNYKCPKCESIDVVWDFACHTWPNQRDSGTIFMSCFGCDSAREYICMEDDCNWNYTHGLNPLNPRFADEQESKPNWVDDEWLNQGWQSVPEGMKHIWGSNE